MIDFSKLTPIQYLKSIDIEYKEDYIIFSDEAFNYLAGQNWCQEILDYWFFNGWGGIFSIFLFKIAPSNNADEFVWIVTGDLPIAYIDIESAPTGNCAAKVYTNIMSEWIHAVKNGEDLDDVFPVNVPPVKKYANMLESRINFIREKILSTLDDELKNCPY